MVTGALQLARVAKMDDSSSVVVMNDSSFRKGIVPDEKSHKKNPWASALAYNRDRSDEKQDTGEPVRTSRRMEEARNRARPLFFELRVS